MSIVKVLASRERGSPLSRKQLPSILSKKTSVKTFGTKLTETFAAKLQAGCDTAVIERVYLRSEWTGLPGGPVPHHPTEFTHDSKTPEIHRPKYFNFPDHLANADAAARMQKAHPNDYVLSGPSGVKLKYMAALA